MNCLLKIIDMTTMSKYLSSMCWKCIIDGMNLQVFEEKLQREAKARTELESESN